jgi:hypothetical protein
LLTKRKDGSIQESELGEIGEEPQTSEHGKKAGREAPDLLI